MYRYVHYTVSGTLTIITFRTIPQRYYVYVHTRMVHDFLYAEFELRCCSCSGRRKLGLLAALEPWSPFLMMSTLWTVWVFASPTEILEREPRLLLITIGVNFSNITVSHCVCHLVVIIPQRVPVSPSAWYTQFSIKASLVIIIIRIDNQPPSNYEQFPCNNIIVFGYNVWLQSCG